MSAVNPKAHEPSMEEILASIRRIIADDQEELQAVEASRHSETAALRSIRDRSERQLIPLTLLDDRGEDGFGAEFDRNRDDDLLPFASSEPAHTGASPSAVPRFPEMPEPAEPLEASFRSAGAKDTTASRTSIRTRGEDNILSEAADASIADSFGRLEETVTAKSPHTMEEFVAEMLRPLLRDWLDENLPPLVERLVQAEIERISRGRR